MTPTIDGVGAGSESVVAVSDTRGRLTRFHESGRREALPDRAQGVWFGYPPPRSDAGERAADHRRAERVNKAVLGMHLVGTGRLHKSVSSLFKVAKEHEKQLADWVASFKDLDPERARLLLSGRPVKKTFKSASREEMTVSIAVARLAGPSSSARPIGTPHETVENVDTEDVVFSETQRVERSWGGGIKAASGVMPGGLGASVGVGASLEHVQSDAETDLHEIRRTVTDRYEGKVSSEEQPVSLIVHVRNRSGSANKSVLCEALAVIPMQELSDSLDSDRVLFGPAPHRVREVPDNSRARKLLDERTRDHIVGRVLTQLTAEGRVSADQLESTGAEMARFLDNHAEELFDGSDVAGIDGDAVAFPLGPGEGMRVFFRGSMDRDAGQYQGPVDGWHGAWTIATGGGGTISRGNKYSKTLSALGGGGVGVAKVIGKLEYSAERGDTSALAQSWEDAHVWDTDALLHQYRFPFRLEIRVGSRGWDSAERLDLHLGERGGAEDVSGGVRIPGDFVLIRVPGERGIALEGEATSAAEESSWRPVEADDPLWSQPGHLPSDFELAYMKPTARLRSTAIEALDRAHPRAEGWVAKARRLVRGERPLDARAAVDEWAGRVKRQADFAVAAGSGPHGDRLRLQNSGKSHAGGAVTRGELVGSIALYNPRLVRVDHEHRFERKRESSSKVSGSSTSTRRANAGVEADASDGVLGELSASAGVSTAYQQDVEGGIEWTLTQETTESWVGRAYQVVYDAVHKLSGSVHVDRVDALGATHPGQVHQVRRAKSEPDGVKLWVDAAGIDTVLGLDPEQVAKLVREDRLAYQHAHSRKVSGPRSSAGKLEPPPDAGRGIGRMALKRTAVPQVAAYVEDQLRRWGENELSGKVRGLHDEYSTLNGELVDEVGSHLASSIDDAINGGAPLLRTRNTGGSGKVEQLVVVRVKPIDGAYRTAVSNYSSKTTYTIAVDRKDDDGNTVSADASAGFKTSLGGIDAVAGKLSPGLGKLVVRVDDAADKLPGPLTPLTDYGISQLEGAVNDRIGAAASPQVSAKASRRHATNRDEHDERKLRIMRSGRALRFDFGLEIEIDVLPWARPGTYVNAMENLLHGDRDRRDVVNKVWTSRKSTIGTAVELTVTEDEYAASTRSAPMSYHAGSVRGSSSWRGLPADAILAVRPFEARGLHRDLGELLRKPDGQRSRVNAYRSNMLLGASTATDLPHRFLEGLTSEIEIPVESSSLKAVRIEFDLDELTLWGPLRGVTLRQSSSRAGQPSSATVLNGGLAASRAEGKPLLQKEAEHEDAPSVPPAGDSPSSETGGGTAYLVRARLHSAITPEYRNRARHGADHRIETGPDGHVWMEANEAGLRALGIELPAETPPDGEPPTDSLGAPGSATKTGRNVVATSPADRRLSITPKFIDLPYDLNDLARDTGLETLLTQARATGSEVSAEALESLAAGLGDSITLPADVRGHLRVCIEVSAQSAATDMRLAKFIAEYIGVLTVVFVSGIEIADFCPPM